MRGRIQLEQTSVWVQLKLDEIDCDLIKECSQQIQTMRKSEILELKRSINYYKKSGSGKARHEDSMHWYLVRFHSQYYHSNLTEVVIVRLG